MSEFADKTVVVTGGSRGIGAEISKAFASAGARAAILYRSDETAAEALCGEIRKSGGEAIAIQADIGKPHAVTAAVEQVAEQFSKIDVLVNAAGVGPYLALADITEDHYRQVFDTNVLGTIMMIQACVPHMPAEGGRIVNFASRLAYNPLPGSSVYSSSKAAVICLTHTYARELGARNITVNAIAPGVIETDMTREIIAERGEGIIAQTPLHRIGQPDDIAGVALFLASAGAKWITGRTLIADGGLN